MEALPENRQRQVLGFVQALQLPAQRGVSSKQVLQFAATISPADLESMRQRIDSSDWVQVPRDVQPFLEIQASVEMMTPLNLERLLTPDVGQ